MVNEATLTNRLIKAENELLALKTAHNRGLGTMKIYRQIVNVEKEATPSPLWGKVKFTISISRNDEPFPLLKILPNLLTGVIGIYYVNVFSISNDGYTIYASAEAVLSSSTSSTPIKFLSTSEIESITYTIERDS